MKITVCQIDNIPKNFQQSFKNLSNYLSVNKTDLLLLPEMPFSKWLSKDKKPNVKKGWQIVEMNGIDLVYATFEELKNALRMRTYSLKMRIKYNPKLFKSYQK